MKRVNAPKGQKHQHWASPDVTKHVQEALKGRKRVGYRPFRAFRTLFTLPGALLRAGANTPLGLLCEKTNQVLFGIFIFITSRLLWFTFLYR
jgi:hypothetical protein